jgi:hypothetical protein
MHREAARSSGVRTGMKVALARATIFGLPMSRPTVIRHSVKISRRPFFSTLAVACTHSPIFALPM